MLADEVAIGDGETVLFRAFSEGDAVLRDGDLCVPIHAGIATGFTDVTVERRDRRAQVQS